MHGGSELVMVSGYSRIGKSSCRPSGERFDPADRLPDGEALAEIRLDSRGGLVALLGGLGEKLP